MNKDGQFEDLTTLLKKYHSGTCSEEEKRRVEQWYDSLDYPLDRYSDEDLIMDIHELQARLLKVSEKKVKSPYTLLAIAASIIFIIGLGFFFYKQELPSSLYKTAQHDILPGNNHAIITLDNGDEIVLKAGKTILVDQKNGLKYANGSKIVDLAAFKKATVTTPNSSQLQMVLSDGTQVWLNSASSISYPIVFEESQRAVTITGEAYFEVAKDRSKPFIVNSKGQMIKVLGTHFNVNAHEDHEMTLTTLNEGEVEVTDLIDHAKVVLAPGQQAIRTEGSRLQVKQVNADDYSAWKDGLYVINEESLLSFSKKLERWYDIEFDVSEVGNTRISAIIPRNAKLSEVLQAIQLKTGLRFKVSGRRVTIAER